MIIQNILWPQADICSEERLYFRKSKGVLNIEQSLVLAKGDRVSFDTYFNSVSADKWKKYTKVSDISLTLKIKGYFCIRLYYKKRINEKTYKKCVLEKVYKTDTVSEIVLDFSSEEGMVYFSIEALEENSTFYGGYYSSNISKEASDVKIAIGICTFCRESFIEHNLQLLNKYILENPSSELYGRLEVFISDNGKTLDIEKLSSEHIHIVQNKNVGGSGGFTRDLIEMLDANKKGVGITHALLMDDDIIIDPESLLKTYRILSLIKDNYKDAFIGGAMLRNDAKNIQVESGAVWNAGRLVSLKANLDMNKSSSCLINEAEEYAEYNAWWYCCFPMRIINEVNLPLPLFIRGDDVEYGLRNMKKLILMNGICVWHEPFENKYSSALYYYILRNQFIDNALHCPEYNKRTAKRQLLGSIAREIIYYRYKNVDLILKGVRDYLKGIDFLLHSDGEALHKEIMAAGYKARPVKELDMPFSYEAYKKVCVENDTRKHRNFRLAIICGYFLPAKGDNIAPMAGIRPINAYRANRILNYDEATQKGFITKRSRGLMIKKLLETFKVILEMDRRYNKATREYKKRARELQSLEFWKRYLEL